MNQSAQIAAWIVGMASAVALVGKLGGSAWSNIRALARLADVLTGQGERPGIDVRLERIEDRLGIVESLDHRVTVNEGRIGQLEATFQSFIAEWEALRDHAKPAADPNPAPVAGDR